MAIAARRPNSYRELEVGASVAAPRRGRGEAEHPERLPARHERHRKRGPRAERAERAAGALRHGKSARRKSSDSSGMRSGSPVRRTRWPGGASPSVGDTALQLPEQRLFRGVSVCARRCAGSLGPPRCRYAPVRERAHAEAAEARKRLFVIERLREHRPRFGEERGLRPRPRPPPAPLLLGEQQRVLKRDRGLRCEELQGDEPIGREGAGKEVVLEIEQADHLGLPSGWAGRGPTWAGAPRSSRRRRTCPRRRRRRSG